MKRSCSFMRILVILGVATGVILSTTDRSSAAELLKGNVSKTGTGASMRLARPSNARTTKMPPVAPPRRLARAAGLRAGHPLVDNNKFQTPMSLRARRDSLSDSIVKPSEFAPVKQFDMGAERNSKELRLAWEKWHKQLSKTIYDRWSAVADRPGRATLKVTVRRNRSIDVVVVKSSGNHAFDRKLLTVIRSLSGNNGLTFPHKSQRQKVSFTADYMAARNVTPGYTWVKDDYETVREFF